MTKKKRNRRKAALKAWETKRKNQREKDISVKFWDGIFEIGKQVYDGIFKKEEPKPEPEKPKGREALSPFLRE
ncbi:MAG: hypothetical protein OEX01_05750 [Candidatus Bathyarchaeota archaeon]|nr:hypothetical protein [Candidatus Bathyarchaeota archaeon]